MKARRSIPHIKKEIKKEKEVHSKEKVNITQYVLSKDKDIKEQIVLYIIKVKIVLVFLFVLLKIAFALVPFLRILKVISVPFIKNS